jgi:hypothetical protein
VKFDNTDLSGFTLRDQWYQPVLRESFSLGVITFSFLFTIWFKELISACTQNGDYCKILTHVSCTVRPKLNELLNSPQRCSPRDGIGRQSCAGQMHGCRQGGEQGRHLSPSLNYWEIIEIEIKLFHVNYKNVKT